MLDFKINSKESSIFVAILHACFSFIVLALTLNLTFYVQAGEKGLKASLLDPYIAPTPSKSFEGIEDLNTNRLDHYFPDDFYEEKEIENSDFDEEYAYINFPAIIRLIQYCLKLYGRYKSAKRVAENIEKAKEAIKKTLQKGHGYTEGQCYEQNLVYFIDEFLRQIEENISLMCINPYSERKYKDKYTFTYIRYCRSVR